MEESISAFKILIDKLTGNESSGRLIYKWEENIWMNFKGIFVNMSNWMEISSR